jgi:hypothetical protein
MIKRSLYTQKKKKKTNVELPVTIDGNEPFFVLNSNTVYCSIISLELALEVKYFILE